MIEIFTGPNCSYCERSKSLLDDKGIKYEALDIESSDQIKDDLMTRLPHARSLPQIFIDGKHIGSYEDLVALNDKGELTQSE